MKNAMVPGIDLRRTSQFSIAKDNAQQVEIRLNMKQTHLLNLRYFCQYFRVIIVCFFWVVSMESRVTQFAWIYTEIFSKNSVFLEIVTRKELQLDAQGEN